MELQDYLVIIGQNIREIRAEKAIKQRELADAIDVPRSNINAIESGKVNVTVSTLLRIANALEVSPDILLKTSK